jgi:hypothetical protein
MTRRKLLVFMESGFSERIKITVICLSKKPQKKGRGEKIYGKRIVNLF